MNKAAQLLLCMGLLTGGCAHSPADEALPQGRVAARLLTLDGKGRTLAASRGKVVLVTVITTWSGPALVEVPLLNELQRDYGPDLEVLCVALDEDPAMIKIFGQSFNIEYTLLQAHDPALFTGPDGPLGPINIVPTSVLLDRQGRIAARMDGLWAPNVLREAVRSLVETKSSGS